MSVPPAARPDAVILTADARIFPAAVFAASRLIELRKRATPEVIIFTDSASADVMADQYFLPFKLRKLPTGKGHDAAYYQRFRAFDALARSHRRVLYLDVDTWVENDAIFRLFDLDMEGHAFAGVRDAVVAFVPGGAGELDEIMGVKGTKYLNTGVLLVDMKRYTAGSVADRMARLVRYDKARLMHRDQSLLNLLLQGDWLELSPSFNLFAIQWDTFVARVCPPAVVHFTGPGKPWMGPRFTLSHPARAAMEKFFTAPQWKTFLPGFFNLSDVLDPRTLPRQGNFDQSFAGKAEFIRHMRETRFADEAAGIVTLHREYLPAL